MEGKTLVSLTYIVTDLNQSDVTFSNNWLGSKDGLNIYIARDAMVWYNAFVALTWNWTDDQRDSVMHD